MSNKVFERFLIGFSKVFIVARIVEVEETDFNPELFTEIKHPNVIIYDRLNFKFILHSILFRKGLFEDITHVVARVPGVWTQMALHLIKIKFNNKIKIGLEVVGCPYDSLSNHKFLTGRLLAPIIEKSQKYIVRVSSYACYVTRYYLQNRYPTEGKSTFASNVVFSSEDNATLVNNIEKHEEGMFTIGMVGNAGVPYKGHDILINALNQINVPVTLSFVGSGSEEQWQNIVSKITNKNIKAKVIGRLKPGKDMSDWYRTLSLFVNPSRQEGLPRCVIEAMGEGRAVLASSVAGTPELLDKEYLHQPGDYIMLSKQIEKLISEPSLLVKMGKRNHNKAKEYDYSIINQRRINFWADFSRE